MNRPGRGPISGLKNTSESANSVVVNPAPKLGAEKISLSTNSEDSTAVVVLRPIIKNVSTSLKEFWASRFLLVLSVGPKNVSLSASRWGVTIPALGIVKV
jgi:hypothetical protein